MLSMTTDYATSTGCPEPALRGIAEAGFTHVHWCHQWNTDFIYHECEIDQIARWMKQSGLGLTDLHASSGNEKCWTSPREHERRAGVELVRNRIEMCAALGGNVIIMHTGSEPEDDAGKTLFWSQLHKSLDVLEPSARERGVRIAIENGNFGLIEKLLQKYGPDFLGLCYDSGHGNLHPNGLDRLEGLKDRLISTHLHDNDGASDQHKLLFTGTVGWPRLARVIAESSYEKWVSLETTMRNCGIDDETEFLAQAFDGATRFAHMLDDARVSKGETA